VTGFPARIIVDRSRSIRGPWRAPGRFVVPLSQGIPTNPICTSAYAGSFGVRCGRRIKVGTPAKRGRSIPETGWKNGVVIYEFLALVETFSAIIEIISNIMAVAVSAVIWFGLSLVGIMQTMSPPTMFIPRTACSNVTASSISNPFTPASMLDTPGAMVGQGNQGQT